MPDNPHYDMLPDYPDTEAQVKQTEAPAEDLPFSLETEQALLGAILVNNDALLNVRGFMKSEYFYEPVHGRIYESVCTLSDKGQVADPIRLKPYFEGDEALEDVGGTRYLVDLAMGAATIINAPDYARTVQDLALRRKLIVAATEVAEEARTAGIEVEPASILEAAESRLGEIYDDVSLSALKSTTASAAVYDALEDIEEVAEGRKTPGIPTKLEQLDDIIGGVFETDLVIIAGRPAMGKSLLAGNIARAVAEQGFGVHISSMEMPAKQFGLRMMTDYIYQHSGQSIEYRKARRGGFTIPERQALRKCAGEIAQLPIQIDDRAGVSVPQLRNSLKRLKMKWEGTQHPLKLAVVDYLGLMQVSDRYRGSKNNEVGEITRGLKILAGDLGITIVALCQLNRGVEARDDKRPLLSDLRDSGSIEQDADSVLFVYRDHYYKQKEAEGSLSHPTNANRTIELNELDAMEREIDIIVAKQRNGSTGIAREEIDLKSGAIRTPQRGMF